MNEKEKKIAMIIGAVLLLGIITWMVVRATSAGKRSEERSERTVARQGSRTERLQMRRAFRGRQGRKLAREMYKNQALQAA